MAICNGRCGQLETVDTDILVVGSGAAGLSAAVHAAMAGANVLVAGNAVFGEKDRAAAIAALR